MPATPLTANSAMSDCAQDPTRMAAWVERLFQRLAEMYGKHWLDMWAGIPLEGVKRTWEAALAEFTADELRQGLAACRLRYFPPTLPEFRNLCRPPLDMEAQLLTAIREMQKRRQYQPQSWPSNRLFWAAAQLGGDLLTQSPQQLAKRFTLAWDAASIDIDRPIPPTPHELPAPGRTATRRAQAQQHIQALRQLLAVWPAPSGEQSWDVDSAPSAPCGEQSWAVDSAPAPGGEQSWAVDPAPAPGAPGGGQSWDVDPAPCAPGGERSWDVDPAPAPGGEQSRAVDSAPAPAPGGEQSLAVDSALGAASGEPSALESGAAPTDVRPPQTLSF